MGSGYRKFTMYPLFYVIVSLVLVVAFHEAPMQGIEALFCDISGHCLSRTERSVLPQFDISESTMRNVFFPCGPFELTLNSSLLITTPGRYRFQLTARGNAIVTLDDQPLIKVQSQDSPVALSSSEGIQLQRGLHSISVTYSRSSAPPELRLTWRTGQRREFQTIAWWRLFVPGAWSGAGCLFRALQGLIFLLWLALTVFHSRGMLIHKKSALVPRLVHFTGILLAFFAFMLVINRMNNHSQQAVHGCDSYGYLQAARSMCENGFSGTMLRDEAIPLVSGTLRSDIDERELMFFQAPHAYHIVNFQTGMIANQYPPGFPLLLAVTSALGGDKALFRLNMIAALCLAIVLFGYFFQRLSVAWSLLLTCWLLSMSLFFEYAILLMSDMVSTLLLVVLCLLLSGSGPKRLSLSMLTGVLFGLALMIRYTNVLFIVPVLILLMLGNTRRIYHLLIFSLSSFITGVLPLALYQHVMTGSFFSVTYNFTNIGKVSIWNIPGGFSYYLEAIAVHSGSLLLTLFVAGIWIGMADPRTRRVSLAFISFIATYFLFTCSNAVLLDRYLLPLLPPLVIMASIALAGLGRHVRAESHRMMLGIPLFAMILGMIFSEMPQYPYAADRTPAETSYGIADLTPTDARILCDDLSGSVRLYGTRVGYRIRWLPESLRKTALTLLLDHGYPLYLIVDCPEMREYPEKIRKDFDLTRIPFTIPLYRIEHKRIPAVPEVSQN